MCVLKFKKNIELQKRTLERGDKNCNVPGGDFALFNLKCCSLKNLCLLFVCSPPDQC